MNYLYFYLFFRFAEKSPPFFNKNTLLFFFVFVFRWSSVGRFCWSLLFLFCCLSVGGNSRNNHNKNKGKSAESGYIFFAFFFIFLLRRKIFFSRAVAHRSPSSGNCQKLSVFFVIFSSG